MSFTSTVTVLPLFVQQLGGSPFAIGLIPAIFNVGWLMPQLLTAPYVERLARKKRFVLLASLNERFPFWLLGAFILIAAHQVSNTVMLLAFFATFLWWCLGGGITATGWQDLMAKVMPPRRRGFFFGTQSAFGGLLGSVGAVVAGYLLDRYPFPTNFAYCFLIAGACMTISYVFLALTREQTQEPTCQALNRQNYWQHLSEILRHDRDFTWFLVSRSLAILGGTMVGFLSVFAVTRFGMRADEVGWLTSGLFVAQTLTNPLWGILGDRRGHKVVLEWATLCAIASSIVATVAPASAWLILAFILAGAAWAGSNVAGINIVFDFAPPHERPTYIGLTSTLLAPSGGIGPLLGGWLVTEAGYGPLFVSCAICSILAYGVLRWGVREPRT